MAKTQKRVSLYLETSYDDENELYQFLQKMTGRAQQQWMRSALLEKHQACKGMTLNTRNHGIAPNGAKIEPHPSSPHQSREEVALPKQILPNEQAKEETGGKGISDALDILQSHRNV